MTMIKHGESWPHTKEYEIWASMLKRCRNKNNAAYPRYGGRGIRVCERWLKYENFLADMGRCPEGYTLERINNDGNYELANCRWDTRAAQAQNRRMRSDNSSGVMGVCPCPYGWRAYGKRNGKKVNLGFYTELADAVVARRNWEEKVCAKI